MASSDRSAKGLRVRFGAFELDPDSGELRKSGIAVHLPPQPTQLLILLTRRAGEVVTREEIREALWGSQTIVDFEPGLNHCINQIRTALCDDAATPRYVQTLPRRGYRFVAPVVASLDAGPEDRQPNQVEAEPETEKLSRPWGNRQIPWLIGVATLICLAAAITFAVLYSGADRTEPPLRRFSIVPAQSLHITSFNADVVLSPDGRKIAYRGDDHLYIQELDQDKPGKIEAAGVINVPFWSPDSRLVGLRQGEQLKAVPIDGGLPGVICPLNGDLWSGSWSPDGEVIAFTMGARPRLYQVAAKGGQPRLILDPSAQQAGSGEPDGAVYAVRFVDAGRDSRIILFSAGPPGEPRLYAQDLKTGRRTSLGRGTLPWYTGGGHIVYQESALSYSLWAIPFSISRLAVTGKPFQVSAKGRDPSVSQDGTLVYVEAEPPGWKLTWRDRQGRRTELPGEHYAAMHTLVLSADERFAAIAGGRDSNFSDLWVQDLVRGTRVRLTRAEEEMYNSQAPAWSRDGREVAYAVSGAGISVARADGTGQRQVVYRTPHFTTGLDWSRDGLNMVFSIRQPGTNYDLHYLGRPAPEGAWQARPFVAEQAIEEFPRLSPDGRYVAYQSNVTGRREVYVRSFPDGEQEWAISNRGGRSPRWRPDGRELYYVDEGHTLMAVPVESGERFAAGREERLFQLPERGPLVILNYLYDAGTDGRRFLVAAPTGPNPPPRIRVVQNWYAEFKRPK